MVGIEWDDATFNVISRMFIPKIVLSRKIQNSASKMANCISIGNSTVSRAIWN